METKGICIDCLKPFTKGKGMRCSECHLDYMAMSHKKRKKIAKELDMHIQHGTPYTPRNKKGKPKPNERLGLVVNECETCGEAYHVKEHLKLVTRRCPPCQTDYIQRLQENYRR